VTTPPISVQYAFAPVLGPRANQIEALAAATAGLAPAAPGGCGLCLLDHPRRLRPHRAPRPRRARERLGPRHRRDPLPRLHHLPDPCDGLGAGFSLTGTINAKNARLVLASSGGLQTPTPWSSAAS
jgi:hypothetical protein